MASTPSTPENNTKQKRMSATRSLTLPPKLSYASTAQSAGEIGAADSVETLFFHPSTTIVKLNTSTASRPSSAASAGPASRGLPWASPSDRMLASGQLEIYRVPGSVSFLRSGSLLQAIMPRSQCWCVDGVSKFAFRVSADTYYRIELPGETKEELELVEELKKVLGKVMYYERTACPFARGFSDELPEMEDVRYKKVRRKSAKAKRWTMDRANSWKPEDGEYIGQPPRGGDSSEGDSNEDDNDNESDGEQETEKRPIQIPKLQTRADHPSQRPKPTATARSVTAPPQLSVRSTPPSRLRTSFVNSSAEVQNESRTFQNIPTDMPPSPPDSSAGLEGRDHDVPETILHDQQTIGAAIEDTRGTESEGSRPESKQQEDNLRDRLGMPNEPPLPMPEALQKDEATHPPPRIDDNSLDVSTTLDVVTYGEDSLPRSLAALDVSEMKPQGEPKGVSEGEPPPRPLGSAYAQPQLEPQVVPQEALHAEPQWEPHEEQEDEEPATPTRSILPRLGQSTSSQQGTSKTSGLEDPFAAIQARILARRSIGGTTSFYPSSRKSTSSSSASTSSSATISSTRSHVSVAHQQNLASALVNKACVVFLGPPAHLVTAMLRIAARFANGTFGQTFFVESPVGFPKRVPGSFHVSENPDSDDELTDWEEDDFGVPLRSPIRLAAVRERRGGDVN